MDVYTTDKIRNVVFLGHGSSGKTTLTEAMANLAGLTSRLGNVTDGKTVSDFDKEEIKRKFSISTAVVPIPWNKHKVNVLDAPGYFDFVGEAEEAAGAADAAVICLSAKDGVQVGTKKAWDLCEENNLPRMFVVTGMDYAETDYHAIVEELAGLYGTKVVPLMVPMGVGPDLKGYVSITKKAGFTYGAKGAVSACDVPGDLEDEVETYYNELMENVAESSEEFMEKFFGGEEFTDEEIAEAVGGNIAACDLVPVCFVSATELKGVSSLLNEIIDLMPSPAACKKCGKNDKTGEDFNADYDSSKEKSVYVWKTMVDPFIGKYSLIKVCSGTIKGEDVLYNAAKGNEARLGKVYVMTGNKPAEIAELCAGDIGALAKNDAETGETLSTKACPVIFEKTKVSTPYTYKRYKAVKKGDEDKIAQSLARLCAEDPTLRVEQDGANRQSLLYGMGEQHLDIVASKLKERYKTDIELVEPKVAFRETIRGTSDVQGRYKKQTGGHGQFGDVKMKFSPGDQSKAFEFEISVVGGTVPKNYYPAVEKGLAESVQKGPLAAYPVVGVKANLYDGSYHPVDSSEQAFKTATHMAFKEGFLKAGPILLEPIVTLKVTVPNDFTGDVMGDLNKRRGRVLGMDPGKPGTTVVVAEIPQMEIYGYGTTLRSMTGGAGDFSFEFTRYEQAPQDVQEKQIKARQELLESGEDD